MFTKKPPRCTTVGPPQPDTLPQCCLLRTTGFRMKPRANQSAIWLLCLDVLVVAAVLEKGLRLKARAKLSSL